MSESHRASLTRWTYSLRIDVSIQGYSAAPQIIALCNGVTNCPLPQNQDVISTIFALPLFYDELTINVVNGQLMLNASYTANLPSYIWTAPDLVRVFCYCL